MPDLHFNRDIMHATVSANTPEDKAKTIEIALKGLVSNGNQKRNERIVRESRGCMSISLIRMTTNIGNELIVTEYK